MMVATHSAEPVPVVYYVSVLCFVDEADAELGVVASSRGTKSAAEVECESRACTSALDLFMPLMYNELSSRLGFQWGKLVATRVGDNTYRVNTNLICVPEPGDDALTFGSYVDRVVSDALSSLASRDVEFERAA